MPGSMQTTSRVLAIAYLVTAGACTGYGGCSDGAEDPCEADAFSCRSASGIEIDPNCEVSAELLVELGQGEHGFAPLEQGYMPRVHNGAQGGQHIFVAVRISGGDPGHASFLLDVALYERGAYQPGAAGADAELEDSGRRKVLIEDAALSGEGTFEQAGIVLQVYGGLEGADLVLEVTDSCGRTASDVVRLGQVAAGGGSAGERATP
jgi:hypothetical protein